MERQEERRGSLKSKLVFNFQRKGRVIWLCLFIVCQAWRAARKRFPVERGAQGDDLEVKVLYGPLWREPLAEQQGCLGGLGI